MSSLRLDKTYDPKAVEAATALGMTPGQVLRQIRLPLAAPVVMAGVRTAAELVPVEE